MHVLAEFHQGFFQVGDFHGGHLRHFGIVGAGEFLVLGKLGFGGTEGFPELQGLLELAVLAEDLRGALRVVEQVGVADRFLEFTEAFLAFGDELGVIHFV